MKVLLIRLRLIGDVVFTTPIPRALKRRFPDARIAYLVEQEAAPVVAGNPHLDEVIVIARSRGWRRVVDDMKLAAALRRRRFDLVVDLHGGPRSSWLAFATGATERVGYDVPGRGWMYTKTVHRPRALRPRHSVANQWDLLGAIDGWSGEPDAADDPVEMTADADAEARIARRLTGAGIEPRHELIIVHVSAGNPFRRWPETSFTGLVVSLASANDERRVILSSGPSDRAAADRIAAAARAKLGAGRGSRILDFGEFNLPELRALVSRSRLFVGGDTGPLHIAATTATPVVGIFGPTLAARSVPWRDRRIPTESVEVDGLPCRPCEQRECAPGDFRCLTTLMPADVISAAERALIARTA
jgi:predicted lipopolysaccharide heptosyltransferase III